MHPGVLRVVLGGCPRAVWQHLLSPAFTQHLQSSKRYRETAISMPRRRQVPAAGRTRAACCQPAAPGLPRGQGEGRSLPWQRVLRGGDDSSGNSPASPGAGGTAGRSQEGARGGAEGAGSATMGSGISACRRLAGHHRLRPCLPTVPGAQAKLSRVKPILRRPSPDTGLPLASGGRCRRLPRAGCPEAGPRCSGPAGTVSPANPGR